MLNPYAYKVELIIGETREVKHQCGLVYGDSYADVAGNIEEYYGEELVSIELLYAMEDSLLILTEDALNNIVKGDWDDGTYCE